ncbi:AraC family transcriptional regulator [Actinosynnema sp. NPDC047251]|uniref:Transcriptional regulator, AraC family n=1 Tax=Saccharothrix espanaensis (strain ATCC 51144 / DSM 44229 / JCM 9112 / NBRC 15066 / NRRL 15764) TaxID=1179773 RepID=K0JY80_SACES|nr:AraC family transcriptional regulator [Saccharothrix espanaensis]CCH29143.1 Transcriptional regulator, AraC family [Saccharothrix espanaensis DSM 44229]
MDALTDLLRGVRAQSALMCRSSASPPWAVRYAGPASLTAVMTSHGDAWLVADGHQPMRLRAGDVGLIRGPLPFVLADDPATPPQVDTSLAGCDRWIVGTRTYRLGDEGGTRVLTGSYEVEGSISDRLLNALPQAFVVPCGPCPTVDLLSDEIAKDQPGQESVLDRLLDLLLVFALREWFDRPEANPPAWYRALGDPVVGPALRAIHDEPARTWTVGELADRAKVSRAVLAKRFTAQVGVPPLTYLTEWRMSVAADLLAKPDATVHSVARAVGYRDGFAFSTAFKRVRGVRPSDHRVVALRA